MSSVKTRLKMRAAYASADSPSRRKNTEGPSSLPSPSPSLFSFSSRSVTWSGLPRQAFARVCKVTYAGVREQSIAPRCLAKMKSRCLRSQALESGRHTCQTVWRRAAPWPKQCSGWVCPACSGWCTLGRSCCATASERIQNTLSHASPPRLRS